MSIPHSSAAGQFRAHAPIYLLSFGHGSLHWVTAILLVLVPYIKAELGLSYTQAGSLLTIYSIAATVANIPAGPMSDIIGRRVLIMAISLAFCGGAMVVMGDAESYWMVATMVGVIGATAMSWHPPAMSYLSIRYPNQRGFAIAMHGFGSSVMQAAGPVAAGLMMDPVKIGMAASMALSWREAAVVNGLLPPVIALVMVLALKRTRKTSGDGETGSSLKDYVNGLKTLVRNEAVLAICTVSAFRKMAQWGVMVFLPLYLADHLKLSPFLVGFGVMVLQASGAVMGPIAGHLSDRFGRKMLAYIGMWGTNAVLIALPFLDNEYLFIVGISFLGFFIYAARPVLQSWIMDLSEARMHGSVTSMMFGAEAALSALAPIIGGVLADLYGLPVTFYFLAAVMLIANLLLPFVVRAEKRIKGAA